jgi:DNA-binding PadR family transcriptional regulator
MYAHAMHVRGCGETGEGSCGGSEWRELRALLRAMSAGRGRRHHRGHPSGAPGGGPAGFSFGGLGGGSWWGGRKARRGDIRSAALLLLAEEPRNGYQIMQEVKERSDGVWSPSPGSVYPALQQLEDEGLIRAEEIEGRRLFVLTDAGREQVERRDPGRPAPWEQMSGDVSGQVQELAQTMRAAVVASVQVIRTGSDAQVAEAQRILGAARRDLYRVLAGEDPDADAGGEPDEKG